MKKYFLLSLFAIIVHFSAQGQCKLINGSFENWSEQELPLELEDGSVITGRALIPDNYGPYFRYAIQLFGIFLGDTARLDQFKNNTQDFLGIDRSEDASEGQYALKLYGDEFLNVSDIIILGDCNLLPESISIDVRHVGTATDSIGIYAYWDKGLNLGSDDENEPIALIQYIDGFETDTDYKTITIPFEQINSEIGDTLSLSIAALFADPASSYFLIDNIRLNTIAKTGEASIVGLVKAGPNPSNGLIQIESEIQNGSQWIVYDALGHMVDRGVFDQQVSIDLTNRAAGMYVVKVGNRSGTAFTSEKILIVK